MANHCVDEQVRNDIILRALEVLHHEGQLYCTLEGKVSGDCSLEDWEEHTRSFFLYYLQLSQEGVTSGFIHVAVI